MLYQHIDNDFTPWTCGAARLFINHRRGHSTLAIGVYCRLGSLSAAELALLDTGAAWTILSQEVAELIREDLGPPMGPVRISTRFGVKEGLLHRVEVRLLADQGRDLQVECTCAVLEDWDGPTVLGWNSMLDRLNLALHPGVKAGDEALLYFGPSSM